MSDMRQMLQDLRDLCERIEYSGQWDEPKESAALARRLKAAQATIARLQSENDRLKRLISLGVRTSRTEVQSGDFSAVEEEAQKHAGESDPDEDA